MARAKKNKKEIVLTKENLMTQPVALILRGVNPTVTGNRVTIAVVKRLRKAFKEIITGYKENKEWKQLSIFATDEVKDNFLGDNKLAFDIHMNEIVDDPKHYQDAFNAVCKIGDVMIWVPIANENGEETMARVPLFTLMTKQNTEKTINEKTGEVVFRYSKHTKPIIGLAMEKVVAEYIFSFEEGYSELLDYPALQANDKYYYPIYAFISHYKKDTPPEAVVDYLAFRKMLGFEDIVKGDEVTLVGYDVFSQFYKRILKPTMEEMKENADSNLSDIWFEVEKIYTHGRAKNPDKLKFIIHLSEFGKDLQNDREVTKEVMAMEERLQKEFKQTKTQMRKIMKEAMKFRKELARKMDELSAAREAGKIKIDSDEGAYWNVAITNFIEKTRMAHEGEKLQFAEAEVIVDAAPAQQAPQAPKADTLEERWGRVMRQWRQMITAAEWRQMFDHSSAIRPLWFEDGALTLGVPDKNYYDYFCEKYYAAMKPLIMEVFGEVAVKFDYIR